MREEDFSKKEFNHKLLLNSTKENIFRFIATGTGLISWFLGEVEFLKNNKQLKPNEIPVRGAKYIWNWKKDYELKGQILESKKDDFLSFTFGKDFIVQFILENYHTNKTILQLKQKNLNPSAENEFSYINCCVCWVFFLTNLKSVVENEIDLRETVVINETFINQ